MLPLWITLFHIFNDYNFVRFRAKGLEIYPFEEEGVLCAIGNSCMGELISRVSESLIDLLGKLYIDIFVLHLLDHRKCLTTSKVWYFSMLATNHSLIIEIPLPIFELLVQFPCAPFKMSSSFLPKEFSKVPSIFYLHWALSSILLVIYLFFMTPLTPADFAMFSHIKASIGILAPCLSRCDPSMVSLTLTSFSLSGLHVPISEPHYFLH